MADEVKSRRFCEKTGASLDEALCSPEVSVSEQSTPGNYTATPTKIIPPGISNQSLSTPPQRMIGSSRSANQVPNPPKEPPSEVQKERINRLRDVATKLSLQENVESVIGVSNLERFLQDETSTALAMDGMENRGPSLPSLPSSTEVVSGDEETEVLANQIRYLPVEMLEMIFTRMGRADHPQICAIAKFCRGLIISPEFYRSRLELGLSESVVYAFIRYRRLPIRPTWCLLNPKLDSLLLSRVTRIPRMLRGSTVVTTDCRMFIVGGYNRRTDRPVSSVFMVDCRTHTHIELPRMKIPRAYAVAGVIDSKLYVVGGFKKRIADWVEMFDFEQNRWESIDGPQRMTLWRGGNTIHGIVLNDVIYAYDLVLCMAYTPSNKTWKSWYSEDSIFCSLWRDPYCVCDGRLFVVDEACVTSDRVKFFHSQQNQWIPVQGIHLPNLRYQGSKMTYVGGGKILILATDNNHLWSIRVEVHSDEEGVLSGRLESASLVVTYIKDSPPTIDHCVSLTY